MIKGSLRESLILLAKKTLPVVAVVAIIVTNK